MNDIWVCKASDNSRLIARNKTHFAHNYLTTSGKYTNDKKIWSFDVQIDEYDFLDPTPLLPMEFLQ